ncbi:MAG TPA: STAS domain-containing protein [Nitrospirales bacterium]|nr:STAS domain-containing protein [Nitrospirales bacterium]
MSYCFIGKEAVYLFSPQDSRHYEEIWGIGQESQEIADKKEVTFGDDMHVTERMQDTTLVLMISGRVTVYSRKVFQGMVRAASFSGAKHIIFNMQGVTYMDTVALGVLGLAYLDLNQHHVAMSVVEPRQPVKSLFENANFSELIPTYPTEETALKAIQ